MWKFKTHLHGTVCVSVLIAEILKRETVQLAMGMFLQLNSQGNTISGASDEHIQRGKDDSQWSVCIGYLLSLLFFFLPFRSLPSSSSPNVKIPLREAGMLQARREPPPGVTL